MRRRKQRAPAMIHAAFFTFFLRPRDSLRKLTNACIGKQAQMKKQPRIARISRSGENLAQPYPPHRRPSANILVPVAQANASECQFLWEATRRACLRDGSQDVAACSAAPVWGVGLCGLRVCAGFIRALIREIRAIRGCFIFCGFINATEFLMSMNDSPPQELCGEIVSL